SVAVSALFDVAERFVAAMNGEQIDARLHDLVATRFQPSHKLGGIGLDLLNQHDRAAFFDGGASALQRFQLHALDVDLDEVHPWQVDLVDRQLPDNDGVFCV